jgi:Ca2+-binding EF-hand superfamily protein
VAPPGVISFEASEKGVGTMRSFNLHGIAGLALGLAGVCAVALPRTAFADQEPTFESIDTNHDGKLSREEDAAVAARMFAMMDTNGDRKVTATEMAVAYQKTTGEKMPKGAASAAEIIKTIDTNGDGVLSADEHAAIAKSMFSVLDSNHDGYLSKAEYDGAAAK